MGAGLIQPLFQRGGVKAGAGGYGISSLDVAISSGTVTANGGDSKDGYGGDGIHSNDINLSGSLELTAKAGSPNGKALSQNGRELDLDTIKDKLGPGAKVTATDANGETKQVSIPRPVEPEGPVIPEESSSSSGGGSAAPSAPVSSLPGLTVTDKDGQRISYTSTQSGNTLTVCVGRLTASLHVSLAACVSCGLRHRDHHLPDRPLLHHPLGGRAAGHGRRGRRDRSHPPHPFFHAHGGRQGRVRLPCSPMIFVVH